MARETFPAMLMISSSLVPDSASSVTSVWRLSRYRPTVFDLLRIFIHAILKVVRWLGVCWTTLEVANANFG